MAYSTIIKPNTQMNPVLYTGNGGTQSITGVNFQPDFTWIKDRDSTAVHYLFNAVSGATKFTNSDQNYAEQTNTQSLKSFDTDGFTLGTMTGANNNTNNFASWNWKAGGSPSSNTDGSTTSSVSANTTNGFSIVKYTGNGSAGATIGHGLGSTPSAIFVKGLSAISNWSSYHSVLGNTGYMRLDGTGAFATASTYWNNTSPTSSVFTAGTTGNINANGNDFVAYCFAEKKGFSKFGSYVGNGNADGTFIYTGFKPAYFVIKRTDATENWYCTDIKRNPINPVDNELLLLNSDTATITTSYPVDFLSNGFKIRGNNNITNASSGTYIYMAFAENPLVANTSGGIPTTAR